MAKVIKDIKYHPQFHQWEIPGFKKVSSKDGDKMEMIMFTLNEIITTLNKVTKALNIN